MKIHILTTLILLAIILYRIHRTRQLERERREAPLPSAIRARIDAGILRERGASLLERIRREAERSPNDALDYRTFPDIPLTPGDDEDEEEGWYAPGARDIHLAGRGDEQVRVMEMMETVGAVQSRQIRDWRSLEASIATIDPVDASDRLAVRAHEIADEHAASLFWEVAVQSDNYTAVKWGLLLGAIRPTGDQLEELRVFARHSELTLYVSLVLAREATSDERCRELLVELLPSVHDFGLLQLVYHIMQDEELRERDDVQQRALAAAAANGGNVRAELAAILLSALPWFRRLAIGDDQKELARSATMLLRGLFREADREADDARIPERRQIVERFVTWSRGLAADSLHLSTLQALYAYIEQTESEGEWRSRWLEEVRWAFFHRLDPEIIRRDLGDTEWYEDAVRIAADARLAELLPELIARFRSAPSPVLADVIGSLGEEPALRFLARWLEDWYATRQERGMGVMQEEDDETEFDDEEEIEQLLLIAAIVRHLGRLGTPMARRLIRRASGEMHPWVQSSALTAMAELLPWTLDPTMRRAVLVGQRAPIAHIREAARQAAEHHWIGGVTEWEGLN